MDNLDIVIIKPGRVRCLRCYQFFDSPDRCGIRTCPTCSKNRDREGGIRIIPISHWGAAISAVGDQSAT
jgi:Zn finger protein HypA/HybF involved in hydrogenase expression